MNEALLISIIIFIVVTTGFSFRRTIRRDKAEEIAQEKRAAALADLAADALCLTDNWKRYCLEMSNGVHLARRVIAMGQDPMLVMCPLVYGSVLEIRSCEKRFNHAGACGPKEDRRTLDEEARN